MANTLRNGVGFFLGILPVCLFAGIAEIKVVDPLTPIYAAEDVKKAPPRDTLLLTGPRNGVCSAQVVVLGSGLDNVTASISEFHAGSSVIPEDAVQIRYAAKEEGYSIGELPEFLPGGKKVAAYHDYVEAYYDILLPTPPEDTGVMPVWVTVSIPADITAGDYEATLNVESQSIPVKLTVAPWVCPDPGDMETHVGIVASTESLALYYEKEVWSEAHWQLIEKELALLGPTGNDDLLIGAVAEYACGYGSGGSQLLRFTSKDGNIAPDFAVLDRYLKLYAKYCGKPEHIIVLAWVGHPRGRRGQPAKPEVKVFVDGKATRIPRAYGPGGKEIWGAALDGIRDRVKNLGWDPETICLGLGYDQLPLNEEISAFAELGYRKWAVWSHLRGMKKAGITNDGIRIELGNGMEVAYNVHPYTPKFQTGVKKEGKNHTVQIKDIQGGWGNVPRTYTSQRNYIQKYHCLTQWRAFANGSSVGGYDDYPLSAKGFAFLWFDWFKLPGKSMQPYICRTCDVMSRFNSPALVAAGPDGPVATVRYEMLREGIQECEARIAIERALVEGTLKGVHADKARAVLEEAIKYRYLDGEFAGGHASNNLGQPFRMWGFPDYPQWIDLSAKLFEAADNASNHDPGAGE